MWLLLFNNVFSSEKLSWGLLIIELLLVMLENTWANVKVYICRMSGGSSVTRVWWGAGQLPGEAVDAPSIPGGVQGQVGWGPGQPGLLPDLDVGGPACSGEVGAQWFLGSLPGQAILWFCVILWTKVFLYSLSKCAVSAALKSLQWCGQRCKPTVD